MFADGHGPFGAGGPSTITVNATIAPLGDHEVTDSITVRRLHDYFDVGVALVTYTDREPYADWESHEVCSLNFSDPQSVHVDGKFQAQFVPIENGHNVSVFTQFRPAKSGLQAVLLVPCWKQKSEAFGYPVSATEYSMYPLKDPLYTVNATVSFRNPYGYLPALLYGLFPFSGCLSLLYGFVDVCLVVLINRHRKNALGIQYMLLIVLLLSTGEAVSWFFTYRSLNSTGQPVCCPYPGMLVFSTILKILAGMVARIATTLLCLGYGVVRPSISGSELFVVELFVVSGLGVCYFISVGALEISHILNQSDGDEKPPAVWELLVMATNLCFAWWIFTSLTLTKKNLSAFGQTAKLSMYSSLSRILGAYLSMYSSLSRILGAYVLVSFFLMAMEGAVYSGSVLLDWQYVWLIWAANRLLVFTMLLIVTVIWRPRPNGALYAQMDQVPVTPSSSDASGGGPRSGGTSRGIELVHRVVCALDEDTPRAAKLPSIREDDAAERKSRQSEEEERKTWADSLTRSVHPMSPLPKRDPSSDDDNGPDDHDSDDLEHRIAEPEPGAKAHTTGPSSGSMATAQDPQSPGPPGVTDETADSPGQQQQQPWNRAKSGRRLVFADENGGVLAEISYSNRTHYSKQAGSGPLPGGGRGSVVADLVRAGIAVVVVVLDEAAPTAAATVARHVGQAAA
ncbi:hypothetical protein P43SY_005051 [Pythium insidiosum]|uniref:GOST seven transmembrane domain-containing protein n=1 Tax=Pythium insidiosum TaxID=114742 RepID=A0AAD5M845_PYTIN|nr:hypothetical protein P43SY_005051 [Pythium insidiosum]